MREKLKKIKEKLNKLGLYKLCVLLITFAILTSAIFYCWSVWEKQEYFERQKTGTIDWEKIYDK